MQKTTYTCDYCGEVIPQEDVDKYRVVHTWDSTMRNDYHLSCYQNKEVEDKLDEKIRPE